ncbi:MAG TPA: prolyl oligopeptidase family serine peptidase [Terriglobia bacterium]|nr:prolyl oligopeptidase family serine peptidase [Terriglobia bacterium]
MRQVSFRTWWTGLWARALSLTLAVAALWVCNLQAQSPPEPRPPMTMTDQVKDNYHGVEVIDPYRWLEDQHSPATRAWIDAQNQYTQSLLDAWPERAELKRRVAGLLKIDSIDVPMERNGRLFFIKRAPEQDQGVLYVRKSRGGTDEVLVDPNPLSADHTVSVTLETVSDDGALVAYGLRQGGEDEVTVHLMDVDKRTELPDVLPKADYDDIAIKPDKSGLYYARGGKAPRVFYHTLGTDLAKDLLIFGEGYGADKGFSADLSEGGRYLIIQVWHGSAADQTEIYWQDLQAHGPIKPIVNDVPARFLGQVGGDTLFVQTNWKAPKSRILAVDLRNPARENWKEVVPETSSAIESLALAGGELVVIYTENASSRISIFNAEGKHLRDVPLPAIGSVAGFSGRWAGSQAFYGYTSFHIPFLVQQYEVTTGQQELWAEVKVAIHTERFEVKQVWFTSKDGTRVPMFLLSQKGMQLDGARPTLLTGYGGFNISESPYYSPMAALWVENGGLFAKPNLRGGGEFGEAWHRAGMFEKKQNVFDDFLSAAEWLTQNRYTNPAQLAIVGNSNGGLLVGAALTQRPDLFRAVLCMHPLLDMLRYQKFMEAQYWVSEYGSADDPAQFKYLAAYSPYQNVKPGTKYPAVLLMSGDGDTRVDPLHARKMAARLQAATVSDQPILLRYDTQAGHSGGLPVSKQIDQLADGAEFLMWQLHLHMASANP